MRNYAETVAKIVAEKTGADTEVVEVNKAGGIKAIGVVIKSHGSWYGPVFYINDDFENGVNIEACATELITAFENAPEIPIAEGTDLNFEAIKNKLSLRLLDAVRNSDYLGDKVYSFVDGGFALMPQIEVSEEYVIPVSDAMTEAYGYDDLKVIETALDNCERDCPAVLKSITHMLLGGGSNMLETGVDSDEAMLVLTNDSGRYGAISLFYNGMAERLRKMVGNYYALPSSLHEFIIVPEAKGLGAKELKKMVLEANESVVAPEDVLSDSVLFYDGELKVVA